MLRGNHSHNMDTKYRKTKTSFVFEDIIAENTLGRRQLNIKHQKFQTKLIKNINTQSN